MKRANESAKKSSTDKTSDESEQMSRQVLLLALTLTVDFLLLVCFIDCQHCKGIKNSTEVVHFS